MILIFSQVFPPKGHKPFWLKTLSLRIAFLRFDVGQVSEAHDHHDEDWAEVHVRREGAAGEVADGGVPGEAHGRPSD